MRVLPIARIFESAGLARQFAIGAGCLLAAGCSLDAPSTPPPSMSPTETMDLSIGWPPSPDLWGTCAAGDDTCLHQRRNSPLPLGESLAWGGETDHGITRDANGNLVIARRPAPVASTSLWTLNTVEGTVSRVDTKGLKERARYASVTCFSSAGGSRSPCANNHGCCAADDEPAWRARKAGLPAPPDQSVTTAGNQPVRTAVDTNGYVYVVNDHGAGQASVTRIAPDASECLDRNKNGKIETSADQNQNGIIETDCNGNGVPDDRADVAALPCSPAQRQEYYGLDDECVLWTTNVLEAGVGVFALALMAGADTPSDLWVAARDGRLRRIAPDGRIVDEARLPAGCAPFNMVIDESNVGWVTNHGDPGLCYFDADPIPGASAAAALTRPSTFAGVDGDGIALDPDQNLWLGGGVARYAPNRAGLFADLGLGFWTVVENNAGRGVVASARNANGYYVYSCASTFVRQIPASALALMNEDQRIAQADAALWPRVTMPCSSVALDDDQTIWATTDNWVTRAPVNANGAITQPDLSAGAMAHPVCPAGDVCHLPGGATATDGTGFYRRLSAQRQVGTWSLVVAGCASNSPPMATDWFGVGWVGQTPPGTAITARARSGNSGLVDEHWGPWSARSATTPLALAAALSPNLPASPDDAYLEVEFTLSSTDKIATPALTSIDVYYRCP